MMRVEYWVGEVKIIVEGESVEECAELIDMAKRKRDVDDSVENALRRGALQRLAIVLDHHCGGGHRAMDDVALIDKATRFILNVLRTPPNFAIDAKPATTKFKAPIDRNDIGNPQLWIRHGDCVYLVHIDAKRGRLEMSLVREGHRISQEAAPAYGRPFVDFPDVVPNTRG